MDSTDRYGSVGLGISIATIAQQMLSQSLAFLYMTAILAISSVMVPAHGSFRDSTDLIGKRVAREHNIQVDGSGHWDKSIARHSVAQIPDLVLRRSLYEFAVHGSIEKIRKYAPSIARSAKDPANLESLLNAALKSAPLEVPQEDLLSLSQMGGIKISGGPITLPQAALATFPYGCGDCANALHQMGKLMEGDERHPRLLIPFVTDPDVFRTVLSATRIALDRARQLESGAAPRAASLLEDLRTASSNEQGEPNESAVWKVLSVYGVRGPNVEGLEDLVSSARLKTLFAAAEVLFASVTYLDSLQVSKTGKSYALPNEVNVSVALSKPYHFWLSAFFVRELMSRYNYSAQGAAVAVQVGHTGYEFASPHRNPITTLNTAAHPGVSDTIRNDILVAAAGNFFGRFSAQGRILPAIDLDRVWDRYMAALEKRPKPTPAKQRFIKRRSLISMATTYLKWRKVILPDLPYGLIGNEIERRAD